MLNGDKKEKEFVNAYDQYADAIFRHCYYRIFDHEKAKDFMQETFFRTWKYMANGTDIENIRAFLYRTANNIIIDESRKKKSVSLNEIMEKGFSPSIDTRQATENYFTQKEVVEIINSLDEKYRDVIIMKYIDGFSPKEIAHITSNTESNIYVKLHRGLKIVKEILRNQQ